MQDNPLLSAAVQNRLTAGLWHCKHTYGDLLLVQVCSGPTQVQCHTAFGKMQLPLAQCCCAKRADSSVVLLQKHLWRFEYRCAVAQHQCSATLLLANALISAQCCCAKKADSCLVLLQKHLWRFALPTGVQWPNGSTVAHCFWQNAIAPCSGLLCKTGCQQVCTTAHTPTEICS